MLALIPDNDESGHSLLDENGDTQDIVIPSLLIGGIINTSGIYQYPADASLKTWLKAQLVTKGQPFIFTDDF